MPCAAAPSLPVPRSVNVVMTDAGGFIEVQGTAEGAPFHADELNAMLALAHDGVRQLFELQRAALAD